MTLQHLNTITNSVIDFADRIIKVCKLGRKAKYIEDLNSKVVNISSELVEFLGLLIYSNGFRIQFHIIL